MKTELSGVVENEDKKKERSKEIFRNRDKREEEEETNTVHCEITRLRDR